MTTSPLDGGGDETMDAGTFDAGEFVILAGGGGGRSLGLGAVDTPDLLGRSDTRLPAATLLLWSTMSLLSELPPAGVVGLFGTTMAVPTSLISTMSAHAFSISAMSTALLLARECREAERDRSPPAVCAVPREEDRGRAAEEAPSAPGTAGEEATDLPRERGRAPSDDLPADRWPLLCRLLRDRLLLLRSSSFLLSELLLLPLTLLEPDRSDDAFRWDVDPPSDARRDRTPRLSPLEFSSAFLRSMLRLDLDKLTRESARPTTPTRPRLPLLDAADALLSLSAFFSSPLLSPPSLLSLRLLPSIRELVECGLLLSPSPSFSISFSSRRGALTLRPLLPSLLVRTSERVDPCLERR